MTTSHPLSRVILVVAATVPQELCLAASRCSSGVVFTVVRHVSALMHERWKREGALVLGVVPVGAAATALRYAPMLHARDVLIVESAWVEDALAAVAKHTDQQQLAKQKKGPTKSEGVGGTPSIDWPQPERYMASRFEEPLKALTIATSGLPTEVRAVLTAAVRHRGGTVVTDLTKHCHLLVVWCATEAATLKRAQTAKVTAAKAHDIPVVGCRLFLERVAAGDTAESLVTACGAAAAAAAAGPNQISQKKAKPIAVVAAQPTAAPVKRPRSETPMALRVAPRPGTAAAAGRGLQAGENDQEVVVDMAAAEQRLEELRGSQRPMTRGRAALIAALVTTTSPSKRQ